MPSLFVKNSNYHKLIILPRYTNAGISSRCRLYQYEPYFTQAGFTPEYYPLLPDEYLKAIYNKKKFSLLKLLKVYLTRISFLIRLKSNNLLLIEKELLPFAPAWLELFLLRKRKFILDFDDAIFHNYDLHQSKLVRKWFRKKIDQLMQRADLVLVGNDYLKARAIQAGAKKIEFIPTVVDLNRYQKIETESSAEKIPVIGWIGNPATKNNLNLMQEPLVALTKEINFKLNIIGIGTDRSKLNLEGIPYELIAWSEDTEVQELNHIDIGIMPLFNCPFVQGKCGLKLIQYMACSKAVIASAVGANNTIVQHGINGFLATTKEDWYNYLLILLKDSKKRKKFGHEGRKIVEKNYSTQIIAPKLINSLRNVLNLGSV